MKYIPADKLIAEIKRRKRFYERTCERLHQDDPEFSTSYAIASALKELRSFITSLQQEQPEMDLEKGLNEWMKYGPHTCYPWCTIPDAIKITAEHFYELGRNARKEE